MSEKTIERKLEHFRKYSKPFTVSSLTVGAVHGFSDSVEIPLGNSLENILSFTPTILSGGFTYFTSRRVLKEINDEDDKETNHPILLVDYVGPALTGAAVGIWYGVVTAAGYGVGYLAGKLIK